jgi:hypothetical protein
MSKLACTCGNIIRDQTDFLPYKARWISDQDEDDFHHTLATVMAEAASALQQGKWQDFLNRQFTSEYPRDLDVQNVLSDLLTSVLIRFSRVLYECEECGRLWLQAEGNQFLPFLPEQPQRGVLKKARDQAPR